MFVPGRRDLTADVDDAASLRDRGVAQARRWVRTSGDVVRRDSHAAAPQCFPPEVLPRSVVPRRPRCVIGRSFDRTRSVTVNRAVPNIKSERPAETRDFFVDLLGFEVAMDMGWVVTLASPINPSVQLTIVGNDDPAAPGISVEVEDVDAVHAKAVEQRLEIAYSLRDEEWGVRRFMLREPSGMTVNVLSHRSG